MKKIYSKKIGLWVMVVSLALGMAGLVYYGITARAASLDAGALNISFSGDKLFNEGNIAPGDIIIKDISVTNNGTLPHSFSMSAGNVSGSLANVMQIEPRENSVPIWNQTLSQLASLPNGSKVVIPSIDPGKSRNLQIAAIFPSSSNNDYQGQSSTNFSFTFGNESTDTPEPTQFLSLPPNFGQRIAQAITYNPPAGTGTSGTGENQITTGGTGTAGVGSVSGETTDTKGATTVAKSLCFWWLAILVIFFISLGLFHRYIKEEKPVFWWVWPIVMAAVLYFVQYWFDLYYQPTIFCHWFWAIEAGILIIYYIFESRQTEKK